jgi:GT2 family glycosyltransferase
VPRPWILIPVHHRREFTLRCLRHLRATQGDAGATVAVIDAASADGTAEAVRREFPAAQILSVSADHWWTGAIARGMQAADADGAKTVLWLNDDCLPDSGCIARLLFHAGGAEPAVAGAVCRDEAGRHVPS